MAPCLKLHLVPYTVRANSEGFEQKLQEDTMKSAFGEVV